MTVSPTAGPDEPVLDLLTRHELDCDLLIEARARTHPKVSPTNLQLATLLLWSFRETLRSTLPSADYEAACSIATNIFRARS